MVSREVGRDSCEHVQDPGCNAPLLWQVEGKPVQVGRVAREQR